MERGPTTAPHLLVIDDGMNDYLMLRKALLQQGPRGTWIELADSAEEGIALANSMEEDAVLMGYKVGERDAMWMVEQIAQAAARSTEPRPAVFLFINPETESAGANRVLQLYPWVTVIEKPYHPEGVAEVVYGTIRPKFSRHLKYYNLKLLDLIHTYMMKGQSITFRVIPPRGPMGVIFLRNGELIHASIESETGIEALGLIARIQEGRIRIDLGCATAMRSIHLGQKEALRAAMQVMTAYSDRSFLADTRRRARDTRMPTPPEEDASEQSTQPRTRNLRRVETSDLGENVSVFALQKSSGTESPTPPPGHAAETDEQHHFEHHASVDPLDYLEDTTRGGPPSPRPPMGDFESSTLLFDNMSEDTLLFGPGEEDTMVIPEGEEDTMISPGDESDTMIVDLEDQGTMLIDMEDQGTMLVDMEDVGTIDLDEQPPMPPIR